MKRFLSVLIGLALLAAAGYVFWEAYGPWPWEDDSTEVVTGGQVYSQVDAASQPQLDFSSDIPDFTYSESVEITESAREQMAINPQALKTTAQIEPVPEVNLTSDIVLDANSDVTVAPRAGGQITTFSAPGTGGAGAVAQRVVEFEWPDEFRVGSSGVVRIKLKVLDEGALQPVAEIEGNEVVATPIILNDRFADGYNAHIQATISAKDFDVEWLNEPVQMLTVDNPNRPLEWRWTLEADGAQTSVIAVGLTLSWVTPAGQPHPSVPQNVAIWGQAVEVEVNHVLGLITVPQAGILGTVLAVLGFIGQLPLLGMVLEAFWGALFDRATDRRRDRRRRRR
jgi:hypothetical protein